MTHRERMRRALRRQEPDRVPLNDSFWSETIQRWEGEGLPRGADVNELFDFDWRVVHFDSSFLFRQNMIREDDDWIVRRDGYGAVGRFSKHRPLTEFMEFPVRRRSDWDRLKHRLHWHPDRFGLTGFYSFDKGWQPPDQDWERKMTGMERFKTAGYYVALYCYDTFEATWRKMGQEAALIGLIEEPEWMAEMFEAQIDLLIESYEQMLAAGAAVDGFFMASDLAFRTGLMFSPQLHRELCLPGLRRLCYFLHSHDVDLVFHCDGDLRALLPSLVEAGVDCIQPMEVQAGMDVRELKPLYGKRLSFMGNIGVREMLLPEDQLEQVIADKITTAKAGGGYLYFSDHSVPPDIPYVRYLKVLDLVRTYGAYV